MKSTDFTDCRFCFDLYLAGCIFVIFATFLVFFAQSGVVKVYVSFHVVPFSQDKYDFDFPLWEAGSWAFFQRVRCVGFQVQGGFQDIFGTLQMVPVPNL